MRPCMHNISISNSRPNHLNLSKIHESAAVRTLRSKFSFSSYRQQHIFKRAFVPDLIIKEFPAIANTRTLAAGVK